MRLFYILIKFLSRHNAWEVYLNGFLLREKSEQRRAINYASALFVIMILIMSTDSYKVASSSCKRVEEWPALCSARWRRGMPLGQSCSPL